jgi:hypothetical protein
MITIYLTVRYNEYLLRIDILESFLYLLVGIVDFIVVLGKFKT